MGPKWSVGHFGCIVTGNRCPQPQGSHSLPTRVATHGKQVTLFSRLLRHEKGARDLFLSPNVPTGQGCCSCKRPGTWICVQLLLIAVDWDGRWSRDVLPHGFCIFLLIVRPAWVWFASVASSANSISLRKIRVVLYFAQNWSSRKACHYDEYLNKSQLYKTWIHETGGVRIRERGGEK